MKNAIMTLAAVLGFGFASAQEIPKNQQDTVKNRTNSTHTREKKTTIQDGKKSTTKTEKTKIDKTRTRDTVTGTAKTKKPNP
jgi:hypothetical protein